MPHYALSDDLRMEFNMKCQDTLVPKARVGDVLVPRYVRHGDRSESVSWLTLFSHWALQQGLSPDHTLELAVAHLKTVLVHCQQKILAEGTWMEFIRTFFEMNDLHRDAAVKFIQWYWTRAARIRFTWYSYKELKAATNNFSNSKLETKVVGSGKVVVTHEGLLPNGQPIIVKKFRQPHAQFLEEVLYEVFLHRSLPKSSHFIKLLGYCSNEHDPLLVYEYVSQVNLQHYLEGRCLKRLTWDDRLAVAIDIADAITQLHYNSKFPIYHRNVTSANILLDCHRRAKLADFGIAAAVSHEKHRSYCQAKVKGTRDYTDPHYESTGKLTDTTDVYSFGVVLMELVTGLKAGIENPAKTFLPDLVVEMSALGLLDDIIDSSAWYTFDVGSKTSNRLNFQGVMAELIELAKLCCALDPTKRPKINDVASHLKRMQREHSVRNTTRDLNPRPRRKQSRDEIGPSTYVTTSCAGVVSVRYFNPVLKLVQNFFRLIISSFRPYVFCRGNIGHCSRSDTTASSRSDTLE